MAARGKFATGIEAPQPVNRRFDPVSGFGTDRSPGYTPGGRGSRRGPSYTCRPFNGASWRPVPVWP
jgi:hypothetical protein